MSDSGVLIVHLREAIPEEKLRSDLASLLGLARVDLVPLDDTDLNSLVLFNVYARETGFHTTLELYVGNAPATVPKTDLELARLPARHYRQDVLISPEGNDPFGWDLIPPGGEPRRVREIPGADNDGIVIDVEAATPIDGDECWRLLLCVVPGFATRLQELRGAGAGEPPQLCNELGELADHVVQMVNTGTTEALPALFMAAERLLVEGNDYVKTTVATCFLEGLQNISSPEVARTWAPLLGNASQACCKVWDDFTGVRTPGLDE